MQVFRTALAELNKTKQQLERTEKKLFEKMLNMSLEDKALTNTTTATVTTTTATATTTTATNIETNKETMSENGTVRPMFTVHTAEFGTYLEAEAVTHEELMDFDMDQSIEDEL